MRSGPTRRAAVAYLSAAACVLAIVSTPTAALARQAADPSGLAQNIVRPHPRNVVLPAEDEKTSGLPGEVVMLLVGTMLMGLGGVLRKPRREDGGNSAHPATTRVGVRA